MNPWYTYLVCLVLIPSSALSQGKPAYPPPAEVKAAFLKLLDRPKVPLDLKYDVASTEPDGTVTEKLSFATEKRLDGTVERVPLLLVRPGGKFARKLPAVLVLHGTGGTKESQKGYMRELVAKGIIGVAIDGRYHGERNPAGKGTQAYNEAIARAWKSKSNTPREYPFYYDTCWDLWRTLDYLTTRDDIDADRIGMIGFSKGGIETWLSAAVDERVKVAVPAIAVQSFRWSLENDKWQGRANTIKLAHDAAAKDLGESMVNQRVCRELWSKVIPGILNEFDCPSMLRLFAGRPMLILSGEKDGNCPVEGARIAITVAKEAYKAAKVEDKLQVILLPEVGHSVTKEQRQASIEWFEKWLKR